jgi:ubiquinone/menaquinone biosynthesis C-methylase UbiE
MEQRFKIETDGLARSWMRYDRKTLRDYLVQGVEDPRINIQSILTRHFLIHRLFGDKFWGLMEQELRFALVVNWLLKLLKASVSPWQLHALLDGLLQGQREADGLEIPPFLSETFASLSLPNYICDLLSWAPVETTDGPIPKYLMNTFAAIWRELLENEMPRRISVLEPGCGSANDYRFIDAYGLSRLLDYHGFDLCEKNIHNAKAMFPQACFKVGNVLEIDAPDKTFDHCFMHDLFEHLSVDAMELAISEICRVTRQGICVGFFNMHEADDHIVKTVGNYHWNKLSLVRTKALFQKHARHTSDGHAAVVDAIHIDTFLMSQFGRCDYHNKDAYTLIVRL